MNAWTRWRRMAAAWIADRRQFRFAALPLGGDELNLGHEQLGI